MKKIYTLLIMAISFLSYGQNNCTADFSFNRQANPNNIHVDVTFIDSSYNSLNQTPVAWYWNFGDGAISYEQNPIHTYTQNGEYEVRLEVVFPDSCSSVQERIVAITNAVEDSCANFHVSIEGTEFLQPNDCSGYLIANASGGTAPYSYYWSIASTTEEITNLCAGTYSITVEDVSGCVTDASYTIETAEDTTIDVQDTLTTNPVDTCFSGIIQNVYAQNIELLDSTTIQITWAFVDENQNVSYITITYTFSGEYGNYYVEISINCNQNKALSTWGEVITIDETTTGINNLKLSDVKLYPNPTNSILFIQNIENVKLLNIYSYTGKLIKTLNVKGNVVAVDVSNLPAGIYFVNVLNGKTSKSLKFVKQ